MSVIFGIKEKDCIIIAADKRGTNINGNLITDDMKKISVINDQLAFSSAGNASIGEAISVDVNRIDNISKMKVDDLIDVIKSFYQRVIDNNCNSILALPFYFIIAGKGKDDNANLISGGFIKGRLEYKEVPMVLYPPSDVKMTICNEIFAKNYKYNHSRFAESTIADIAQESRLVSASGDKWIYHISAQKGELLTF